MELNWKYITNTTLGECQYVIQFDFLGLLLFPVVFDECYVIQSDPSPVILGRIYIYA